MLSVSFRAVAVVVDAGCAMLSEKAGNRAAALYDRLGGLLRVATGLRTALSRAIICVFTGATQWQGCGGA